MIDAFPLSVQIDLIKQVQRENPESMRVVDMVELSLEEYGERYWEDHTPLLEQGRNQAEFMPNTPTHRVVPLSQPGFNFCRDHSMIKVRGICQRCENNG